MSEDKNGDNTATDIRFTKKGDIVYATVLDWPTTNELVIHSFKKGGSYLTKGIESIEFLANKEKMKFSIENDGLHIQLPKEKVGDYAFAFKITPNK